MDYSVSVKKLFKELARIKSYSCLRPVLRIVMTVLMLPFIIGGASMAVVYCVLCFFRNTWQIISDELESWLEKKEQGKHWGPVTVLYLVTFPFIFLVRSMMAFVFSGALYITWFVLMTFVYIASLGGVRWQPQLNKVDYDREYTWDFKHSDKVFNVFAWVNIGFALLCALDSLLNQRAPAGWLMAISLIIIYIVYFNLFRKKDIRELSSADDIYGEAISYGKVNCLANRIRARELMERIPDHENARVDIVDHDAYIKKKKTFRSRVGVFFMIVIAIIIVAAVIIPPITRVISGWIDNACLVYYMNDSDDLYVFCNSYAVANIKIPAKHLGKNVVQIGSYAFEGCSKLRVIEIPETITQIASYAFSDCESLELIKFNGTKAQWLSIAKEEGWDKNTGRYIVECTDGILSTYGY